MSDDIDYKAKLLKVHDMARKLRVGVAAGKIKMENILSDIALIEQVADVGETAKVDPQPPIMPELGGRGDRR